MAKVKQIQAVGNFVYIVRGEAPKEMGGIIIPDMGKKRPAIGEIISVGGLVVDKKIKVGKQGFFNLNAGFELEMEDGKISVLRETEIIGVG